MSWNARKMQLKKRSTRTEYYLPENHFINLFEIRILNSAAKKQQLDHCMSAVRTGECLIQRHSIEHYRCLNAHSLYCICYYLSAQNFELLHPCKQVLNLLNQNRVLCCKNAVNLQYSLAEYSYPYLGIAGWNYFVCVVLKGCTSWIGNFYYP